MKILIDMNLSPSWAGFLKNNNFEAVHWSSIGHATDADEKIFAYAQENDFIVFTSDLDFGTILAFSKAARPSVIQIRLDYPLPHEIGDKIVLCLKQFELQLSEGCLLTLDDVKMRVRILPLM